MIWTAYNRATTIKSLKAAKWQKSPRTLVQEIRIFPSNFEQIILHKRLGQSFKIVRKDTSKPAIQENIIHLVPKTTLKEALAFVMTSLPSNTKLLFREWFVESWSKGKNILYFEEWPGLSEIIRSENGLPASDKIINGGAMLPNHWDLYKSSWGVDKKWAVSSNILFSGVKKELNNKVSGKKCLLAKSNAVLKKELSALQTKYMSQRKWSKAIKGELASLSLDGKS